MFIQNFSAKMSIEYPFLKVLVSFLIISINLKTCMCQGPTAATTEGPTQTQTDSQGNAMSVEKINELPPEQFLRQFFGSFCTHDCTKQLCTISLDLLQEQFWQLYLNNKEDHAVALAALEPCILNGILMYRDNLTITTAKSTG